MLPHPNIVCIASHILGQTSHGTGFEARHNDWALFRLVLVSVRLNERVDSMNEQITRTISLFNVSIKLCCQISSFTAAQNFRHIYYWGFFLAKFWQICWIVEYFIGFVISWPNICYRLSWLNCIHTMKKWMISIEYVRNSHFSISHHLIEISYVYAFVADKDNHQKIDGRTREKSQKQKNAVRDVTLHLLNVTFVDCLFSV